MPLKEEEELASFGARKGEYCVARVEGRPRKRVKKRVETLRMVDGKAQN